MVKGWNNVEIITTAPLPYLLIPVKTVRSEKASLSDMQNVMTVFSAIDWRWQVFFTYERQFIATYSDAFISETKNFFSIFFLHFLNLDSVFKIFKRNMTLLAWMNFWAYVLRKAWLDKFLKNPLSEDTSTNNMINGPKPCSNLDDSNFTIFIDPCGRNSGLKSLSEWYARSWDCLLTHSLPIVFILFLTEAISCNISRCNYLRNENYFLTFFCIF